MLQFNVSKFFRCYKKRFGRIRTPEQVEDIEWLINKIMDDTRLPMLEHKAYVLASIYHETATKMKPIKEYQPKRGWDVRKYARKDRTTGHRYFGRGYIQITHKWNYLKLSARLKMEGVFVDLVNDPDKALNRDISYDIAVIGMVEGLFTRHKLSKHIKRGHIDYVHARKIVNGMDKANRIALYAERFEQCIKAGER